MDIVGIDAGDCRLKWAGVDAAGNPTALQNLDGQNSTPSVLCFEDTKAIIGDSARNMWLADPGKGIAHWKRAIGTTLVLATLLDGTKILAKDVLTYFFKYIKECYERLTGHPLGECVLSVPAIFTDAEKSEFEWAAAQAGLKVIGLVHEPTASLYGLNTHKRADGLRIVADIGGSTTDITLARKEGNVLSVLVTNGARVAGQDYNARLQGLLEKRIEKKLGVKLSAKTHPQETVDLLQRVESIKVALSTQESASVAFSVDGKVMSTKVTRQEFAAATADLTETLVDLVDKTLKEAGVKPEELCEFLLAGGGSLVPMIPEAFEKRFSKKIYSTGNPHLAIAFGNVIMARIRKAEANEPVEHNGVTLPPPDFGVREVTSHTVGATVQVEGTNRLILHPILPKGTPVPSDQTKPLKLAAPGDTRACVEVLQGVDGAPRDQCLILGHFDLQDLPAVHDKIHTVNVRFRLDANGMLTASAHDTISGKSAEMTIDYRKARDGSPAGPAVGAAPVAS